MKLLFSSFRFTQSMQDGVESFSHLFSVYMITANRLYKVDARVSMAVVGNPWQNAFADHVGPGASVPHQAGTRR